MELIARNVTKRYMRARGEANYFNAVDNASLTLTPERVTALMGRSGSGKSTLLQMLGGLLAPTAGEVLADGQSLYALDDAALSRFRNRHIGVVPQGAAAVHSLSVQENVLLPLALYGKPEKEEEKRARELLVRLGIADLADARPSELSGGEMRRMSIARALLPQPEIILADEPTGDLDDENTRIVLELLRETADAGAAVLLVTHEQEAMGIADEVYRMEAGKLRA